MILKEIPGIVGYLASDSGEIYSSYKKKFLKPTCLKLGYLQISIWIPELKKTKSYLVGRLIAKAFVQNPDNKPEIKYIDGNILNTKPDNLKWADRAEILKSAHKNNNKKKRQWIHLKYGTFIGTIAELIHNFPEEKYGDSELSRVAVGKKAQYRGWTVQLSQD